MALIKKVVAEVGVLPIVLVFLMATLLLAPNEAFSLTVGEVTPELSAFGHFLLFGAIGWDTIYRLSDPVHPRMNRKKAAYTTLIIVIILTISIETAQYLIPGRNPEWADIGLGSSGGLLGVFTAFMAMMLTGSEQEPKRVH